jgi:predicted AAA+ superfamily ATPase
MENATYELQSLSELLAALTHVKNLIQILTGPRQVGKSTVALQLMEKWEGDVRYASADLPIPPGAEWINHQWNLARTAGEKPLLIIDEVQKVSGWSEAVKSLWDEDRRQNHDVRVLLLGSSALLMQKGLSDSLTGRFFLHRLRHWQYGDMSRAFDVPLERWLYFGGYPGAVSFLDNEGLWRSYVRDSLIETVLARDVLQMERIAKPALLRHLFMLSTAYPAQILSYNKMLGQLTDAGNTTTLAHYVQVLHSAFLLSGLELFKVGQRPKRGSSPKLILWNNALVNAVSGSGYEATRSDPEQWGRLVENAVGAAILNQLEGTAYDLYYWREKDQEVDYVLHAPGRTWAIEVKSSRMKNAHGLRRFLDRYPDARPFIVGGTGMPLEEFFRTPLTEIFGV